MKKEIFIRTCLFIIYLVIIFIVFFNSDRRMLTIFSAMGSSLYIIFIKKHIDNK